MKFTLPYPPTANLYWRVWRGRAVKSDAARAYQHKVLLLTVGMRPSLEPCCVRITAFRPRKRGDLDNTLKVALDALKGRAYLDDSQVREIHAKLDDDKENPRLEVEVLPLSSIRAGLTSSEAHHG